MLFMSSDFENMYENILTNMLKYNIIFHWNDMEGAEKKYADL